MKTFIIHYHKLTDRKQYISDALIRNNMDQPEFVQHYDRNTLTLDDHSHFSANIPDPAKAIALSHIYCYREISDKHDYALILEDDALFDDSFKSKLDEYMTQLPSDWDMLFLGDGCDLHIPNYIVQASHTNIFKKTHEPTSWGGDGATRCVDSYVVNKKCAEVIINNFEKLGTTIDWWLNNVIRKHKFNVYWAEPTIVTQGSQNSFFTQSYPA